MAVLTDRADNLFAGPYLDRRAGARLHGEWLAEARHDQRTLYVAMCKGAALVRPLGEAGSRVAFLASDDPRIAHVEDPERLVLLGWYLEQRCVMVDLPEELAVAQEGERFAELRPLASELAGSEAGLVAYARALNLWRLNHRFCGACGTPTTASRAGHARRCARCERESFPRLDPAVIVLVHDGERALLGRQAGWAPGRYSTIAGFVEPGESLEDAVHREVQEETGIAAADVTYHSSQPWPFPASLMLGFTARARPAAPELRDGELEDARWFSRAELAAGAALLPPPHAISRRLIDAWLQSG
jgi:NAD+ diphosphatase